VRTVDVAAILLGAILIGGFIAIGTGLVAIVGVLQLAGGAGLHHEPPLTTSSITARQRQVDARLRARYMERRRPPFVAVPTVIEIETAHDLHDETAWSPPSPIVDSPTPPVTTPGLA
jgi:hypothetical protein